MLTTDSTISTVPDPLSSFDSIYLTLHVSSARLTTTHGTICSFPLKSLLLPRPALLLSFPDLHKLLFITFPGRLLFKLVDVSHPQPFVFLSEVPFKLELLLLSHDAPYPIDPKWLFVLPLSQDAHLPSVAKLLSL